MDFKTRRLVQSKDLNPYGTLFGGRLLEWIDEEAAIAAIQELGSKKVVTKFISKINFMNSAQSGDIIEIGLDVVGIGTTSITLRCEVRSFTTHRIIVSVDKIVFVHVDADGNKAPHGKIQLPPI